MSNKTFAVGPESGLLSQLVSSGLHRAYHVSGPIVGPGAENAVFRLDFDACRNCMLCHNSERADGSKTRIFTAPLRLLRAIEKRAERADAANAVDDAATPEPEPSHDPPSPAPLVDLPTIDEPHIGGEEGEHDGKAFRLGLGGLGESPEHKRLKEYIANNPAKIGKYHSGKIEHRFESNDETDVYFTRST
jgi:hypothetical protein